MINFLYFLFFSFLAVIGQLTLVGYFDQKNIFLDFPLVLVLAAALTWRQVKISWLALLPVFLFDLLISRVFGIITLSAWFSFWFIRWLAHFLFKKNEFLSLVTLGSLGFIFFNGLNFLLEKLVSFFWQSIIFQKNIWLFRPLEFLLALVLNSFLFFILVKIWEGLKIFKKE